MNLINSLFKKVISLKDWFFKATWKKKLIVIVIVLIAGFLLTSPLRAKPPAYTTEPVTKATVADIVSESGNVASSGRFDVYSPSTGYIEESYVENGDPVRAGDKLFKVKSTATPQEKTKAYSDYLTAQNNLNTQKSQMNSLKAALFQANQAFVNDRGVDNPSDDQKADPVYIQEESKWLQAEADYNNQANIIKQSEAAFSNASLTYQATQDIVVTAPAPGTIANFSSGIGDKVTASSGGVSLASASTPSSPTLVILGDLSKAAIKIPLNEVDVDMVKVGQTATIVFDADREKKYKGHVSTIDTAGTNTNGVITYNATILIDDPDTNIKTEMTATVSIETAKHENVLTVPNSAVKPYKGGKAVIVEGVVKDSQVKNKAGKALPLHYVPVEVGLKGITRTEITKGVTQEMKVVTSSIN
ncbi:MAG TPA: efflux RND transporter periplasmic adaptor subunit [Patescibacteria group bacterium]|nr:efflux RND transporter periplasmic adaptor subunit [Patescibacteria group bacterium]